MFDVYTESRLSFFCSHFAESAAPFMVVSISERSFVIMKLIPVDAIPKMGGYHKLQDLIEEFINGDAKIVKVDFGEDDYKSQRSAGLVWPRPSSGQSARSRYGGVETKCF